MEVTKAFDKIMGRLLIAALFSARPWILEKPNNKDPNVPIMPAPVQIVGRILEKLFHFLSFLAKTIDRIEKRKRNIKKYIESLFNVKSQ